MKTDDPGIAATPTDRRAAPPQRRRARGANVLSGLAAAGALAYFISPSTVPTSSRVVAPAARDVTSDDDRLLEGPAAPGTAASRSEPRLAYQLPAISSFPPPARASASFAPRVSRRKTVAARLQRAEMPAEPNTDALVETQSPPEQSYSTVRFDVRASHAATKAAERAARSGQLKRWKDGLLSGYAVPSAPGADGCRAVRLSVDQDTASAPVIVNSCD
jgi:hypothetical protein